MLLGYFTHNNEKNVYSCDFEFRKRVRRIPMKIFHTSSILNGV